MGTESANQHTIFRQRCKFCGGDHWNDLCPDYATVEVKPQSHIHGFGPGRATVHPDLASR